MNEKRAGEKPWLHVSDVPFPCTDSECIEACRCFKLSNGCEKPDTESVTLSAQ